MALSQKNRDRQRGREIARLLQLAGMTQEQMAEAAAVAPETMRKIVKGYQACSDSLLQSFRNIVRLRSVLREEPQGQVPPELHDAQLALTQLAREDANGFQTARKVIYALHERAKTRPRKSKKKPRSRREPKTR
jgi:transcriptional regulator with XRE-family HTH domain